MFPIRSCLILAVVISGNSHRLPAQSVDRVAGHTIGDYQDQLDSPNRVVRLRAVRSLGAFGAAGGDAVRTALGHEDPAMRYLASVQLGNVGGQPLRHAEAQLDEIAELDQSPAVRMAAAYALCRAGQLAARLPLLIDALGSGSRAPACCAAELIGQLGPAAAAAEDALRETYQANRPGGGTGDYHIGGAAQNALRKIRQEEVR